MADSQRYFTPLRSKPRPRKLAAFDTEGNGSAAGFVCAAVVTPFGDYSFTDRQETLEFLLGPKLRGYWLVSHNLEYDLGVLAGGDLRKFRCMFNGANLLWAEKSDGNDHKWRFIDSQNIFGGFSVKELGLLVGRAKIELHSLLQQYLNHGKPLSDLEPSEQWQIKRYCLTDAQIIYEAVNQLQDELLSLGGQLKPTTAGIAMDLFRRKYMTTAWSVVPDEINHLARQAYYGARTEPYRLGRVTGVNGYDISSLYPSVMAQADFPHPGALSFEASPAAYAHLLDRGGVAQVTITVKEDDPPPLPERYNRHLFFPTGQLTGVWTNREIRHAIGRGATVERCDWIVWSGLTFNPFEEYINEMYRRKQLAASDQPIKRQLYKLLLNALYGRFGLNPDNSLMQLEPIPPNPDWSKFAGGYFYEWQGWPYVLYPLASEETPAYANAFIAAQVTSEARITMYRHIKENIDSLVYTDTDSLWITGTVDTGEHLGQMRQTHENLDLLVVAPKEYAVFSGEHLIEAKAKGIPAQYREAYLRYGSAFIDQPTRIRESLKGNKELAVWHKTRKQRQESLPKRCPVSREYRNSKTFTTRPWAASELQEAAEAGWL